MQTDFDNSFWSFVYYRDAKLVWLKRSPKKLPGMSGFTDAAEGLIQALQKLPRADLKLLSDLREGPTLRNDPSFEDGLRPLRQQMFEGFAQRAFLAKTAVGVLQINRYNREAHLEASVFTSEEEALSFLGYASPPRS